MPFGVTELSLWIFSVRFASPIYICLRCSWEYKILCNYLDFFFFWLHLVRSLEKVLLLFPHRSKTEVKRDFCESSLRHMLQNFGHLYEEKYPENEDGPWFRKADA